MQSAKCWDMYVAHNRLYERTLSTKNAGNTHFHLHSRQEGASVLFDDVAQSTGFRSRHAFQEIFVPARNVTQNSIIQRR